VRLQVISVLQSSVVICSDTMKIVPEVLSDCNTGIFRNSSNAFVSQATSTQPSITNKSPVWWPTCQPVSANKRLNGIQTLASFGVTWAMHTAPCAV
jgi:hypothetical protein